MYAVVKTSGRQFKVTPGTSFSVEKLEGKPGSTLELTDVLMVGGDQVVIGNPFVAGAKVLVVIEEQYRGRKVMVFKKKRRNNYRKMRGHRSELTKLFVSEISSSLGSAKAETKPHVLLADRKAVVAVKKTREERLTERKASEAAGPAAKKAKASTGAKKKTAGAGKKAGKKSGAKKKTTAKKAKK